MNRLTVFAVGAMALFASATAQADPVLEYEMEKDHNFYHVTLYWYDVESEFVRVFSNSPGWTFVQQTAWNHSGTFYVSRTKRSNPRLFWVCEVDPLSVNEAGELSYAATEVCSEPVALSFKGMKPMQGNGRK